ncbi:uncharacterized protein LOC103838179 [Brassica rapa]|uniref:uncharacterized protein LOC103838179 n=1 Tax=Brassica campestris TaxID=3711 RepID=UPI00142DEB71|nr:uncharacterized protein LOC103838179 [Brassica rapa]
MVAKLIPYSSKVHSADQMIIWMTQHRALKLHIERVEIHKKSYEADGTFGSPDHSLSQLQKVMDTTTDNGTRGLNIYMWQGVGVNAHVEQTDGVAATLVKIQMSTIKLPHLLYQKEGVQHLTIRLLAQRMERRHGWIRSN